MRASNIELLRLFAMLMVVNLHTFFQPKFLQISDFNLLTILDFFRESASISAVNLFVLISGFFSIQWKLKSFFSLIFQLLFWTLGIYFFLIAINFISFDTKILIDRMNCVVTGYWFVTTYIGLYLLAPMINSFVEQNTKGKKLFFFLILFYSLQTYYQLLGNGNFLEGYSILSFCGCYMIGRYIRVKNVQIKRWVSVLGIGVTTVAIMIVAMSGRLFAKDFFIYNNPLIVLQGIFILLFFLNLCFKSRFINNCASSALAIYLFHMHPDLKQHFYSFTSNLYSYPVVLHFLYILFIFILVFIIAISVDKLRIRIFEWIWHKIAVRFRI